MLEQSDIAHYLLSLGVVKPRSVIDEDLTVVDTSRRNCVFLARTSAGPTFVVKQTIERNHAALAHEAAVLRRLAGASEVAEHVPEVVHHEPGRLVLRTPGGARDWGEHEGRFPRIAARVLGRALASLHLLTTELPDGPDPIWGLLLPEPPRELVLELSAGAQDLVARIQASDSVCARLEELSEATARAALVHGDLRWENCLVLSAPGSRRRTRVMLVDWELSGRADPAFDVGTVLAEYLRVWVGSVPIVEAADPGRLVACARHPLRSMWPAVHAFWGAYRQSHPEPPTLHRAMELAGVRLLQAAVERAQSYSKPSAHVMALLQLGANVLRRPDEASLGLLGLRG